MDYDDEHDYWDAAFAELRAQAYEYMKEHNSELPTKKCPACAKLRHCPGFPCPRCGYRHLIPLARVRDTEYGYQVVGVGGFGAPIFAEFRIVDRGQPD